MENRPITVAGSASGNYSSDQIGHKDNFTQFPRKEKWRFFRHRHKTKFYVHLDSREVVVLEDKAEETLIQDATLLSFIDKYLFAPRNSEMLDNLIEQIKEDPEAINLARLSIQYREIEERKTNRNELVECKYCSELKEFKVLKRHEANCMHNPAYAERIKNKPIFIKDKNNKCCPECPFWGYHKELKEHRETCEILKLYNQKTNKIANINHKEWKKKNNFSNYDPLVESILNEVEDGIGS